MSAQKYQNKQSVCGHRRPGARKAQQSWLVGCCDRGSSLAIPLADVARGRGAYRALPTTLEVARL